MVDLAYGGVRPLELPGEAWRKSSYSNPSGDCVETARLPSGRVAVRDSHRPTGPVLVFAAAEWRAFLRTIAAGHSSDGCPMPG
jgi:Domain of unknown function (DUF397)